MTRLRLAVTACAVAWTASIAVMVAVPLLGHP